MSSRATQFAVKIADAKTKEELNNIALEIKQDIKNLDGWVEWLRDFYKSKMDAITYVFTDEHLNKEGKKYGIPENKDN